MRRSLEQLVDPPFCEPTRRQQAFLDRHRLHPTEPPDLYEASHLIGRFIDSRRGLPPTVRQVAFLKARGRWREGMSRGEAQDLIGQLLRGLTGKADR
jgi:hypothetical protein